MLITVRITNCHGKILKETEFDLPDNWAELDPIIEICVPHHFGNDILSQNGYHQYVCQSCYDHAYRVEFVKTC
jgi:hypothetical protein